MKKEMIRLLIETAAAMRQRSYAPYSGYRVGAALLARDGTVYTGCNIENAAFSPTICAERTAFFKAVSEGAASFEAICIVGGAESEEIPSGFSMPCGVCRQVMAEFCDPETFRIIVATDPDHYEIHTLRELLPGSFGPANLVKTPSGLAFRGNKLRGTDG